MGEDQWATAAYEALSDIETMRLPGLPIDRMGYPAGAGEGSGEGQIFAWEEGGLYGPFFLMATGLNMEAMFPVVGLEFREGADFGKGGQAFVMEAWRSRFFGLDLRQTQDYFHLCL